MVKDTRAFIRAGSILAAIATVPLAASAQSVPDSTSSSTSVQTSDSKIQRGGGPTGQAAQPMPSGSTTTVTTQQGATQPGSTQMVPPRVPQGTTQTTTTQTGAPQGSTQTMQGMQATQPMSSGQSMPAMPGSAAAQGRSRNVSATFQDTVQNNCRYRTTVRGTVREMSVSGATADNATQYVPRLQIQSEITCPDGSARTTNSFSLNGPQFAREQLAQSIQDHARLFAMRGEQVCSFAPRVSFDNNGQLTSSGIAQSCTAARGGGPGCNLIDSSSQSTPQPGLQGGAAIPQSQGVQPLGPTGGGPRDTLSTPDVQQGNQQQLQDQSNPNLPSNGFGGTGRDINDRDVNDQSGVRNPILP